jgi:hypothetical protein
MDHADYLKYRKWTARIQDYGTGLTPWERDFAQSIADKLETQGEYIDLSDKQIDALERIYRERTPYDVGR